MDETDRLTPCIGVSVNSNAVYGSDDFHDMVMRAAVANSYVSGSASAMRKVAASDCGTEASARRIPTDEWYRNVFSKMDGSKVAACVEDAISSQLDRLRRMGKIPADGMTVAIDAHLIPCYSKDHGSEMVRSKSKQGTDYFIRYVTAQCVDLRARLMLAAIHMPALESMSDFVRRLVDLARQAGADIKLVLLDPEFFSTDVMKALGDMNVRYLTPCRNTDTVVDALGEFVAGRRGKVSDARITNADRVSVTYTMIITERTRRKKSSKTLLQLLEVCDECDGIEPFIRPEELPAVQRQRPVYGDLLVASGVWHVYPLALGRPVFTAGHGVVYEKRLVLHDHGKSLLFQARNPSFEVVPPVPDCLPVCPVDVYFLRHFGGQVVQAHDLSDVRDVEARAGPLVCIAACPLG